MTRLILIAAITFAGYVYGETAQAKIDAIAALPNVLGANFEREPQSVTNFGQLHTAVIGWYYTENGVARNGSAHVIIKALGTPQEAAYWLGKVPDILAPPVATKYITDRTGGGFTEAQVKTKVAEVWANAVPAAGAIIGMTVSTVDGKTIRVSGSFDNGAGGREIRTYLLWLVDANGSVVAGNANIKWQRETQAEVAAP